MKSVDPLEALTHSEVPPPPRDFDHGVHDRVNRLLLLGQMADLLGQGLPWAVGHFAAALAALVETTVIGEDRAALRRRHRRARDNKEHPGSAP